MMHDFEQRFRTARQYWAAEGATLFAESRISGLWKVNISDVSHALKLYKGPNFGSERFAVDFLKCLKPESAVRVIDVNESLLAVLFEWLPGQSLAKSAEIQDPEAKIVVIVSMAEIVRNTDFGDISGFRPVSARLDNLRNASLGPDCPAEFAFNIKRAQSIAAGLQSEPHDLRAIHGDLRFDNVIVTPEGPRLIDPKAQIGETAFEVAHVLWHGVEGPDEAGVMKARAERYAARVGTTPERLLQWAAVKLALYISFQSGGVITTEPRAPLLSCLLDLAEA